MVLNSFNNMPKAPKSADPFRAMVVDDSAVVRGLIARMLDASPDVDVVTTAPNGEAAIRALSMHDIEVIILDIEMPVMDGLTALPKLLEVDRHLKIIMASTLTLRNADISLQALQAGAADYVPKPSSARDISTGDAFKEEIIEKVLALGKARRRIVPSKGPAPETKPAIKPVTPGVKRERPPFVPSKDFKTRPPGALKPEVLAIGSSTGGPQALFAFFEGIKDVDIKVPIMITQHMPATFTQILAGHISRFSGREAVEATDGAFLEPNKIYIAPGDFHMVVDLNASGQKVLRTLQTPQENFCRPAVDPMLRSITQHYNGKALAVIFTGMGTDGAKEAKKLADAGGTVLAQDEETSVVWGMPGATAASGACSAVLPLKEIAPYVKRRLTGRM